MTTRLHCIIHWRTHCWYTKLHAKRIISESKYHRARRKFWTII